MAVVAALLAGSLAVIIPARPAVADFPWYNNNMDWNHRKPVTINATSIPDGPNLINYPVLVSITDTDLQVDALDSGFDILFTLDDTVTKIPHEIESFNGTTGELQAWVNIPSLSTTSDTTLYMYYDNNEPGLLDSSNMTGTWNSDYEMVQHLQETTGGADAIIDSTGNSNNGTDQNTPTIGATGQVDGAIDFDASDDLIQVADDNSLDMTSAVTLEAWVNTDNNSATWQTILEKRPDVTEYNYYMRLDNGYLRFSFYNGGHFPLLDITTKLSQDTW
ncbi:MAG: DUF2341 domain-containing protein, partial [Dehalococcoidales bacterium]|nr:DUF2341 domain-containing protein [Dehalococcoidales bacterium]